MHPRVVHLDEKNWIELARGYYRRAPGLHEIAQNVVEKSECGQAIFPLSITHFVETARNLNRERRQRLAEYMMLASQGWAILPASFIVEPEIEDACLKHLGLPGYDLQGFAIKRGLSQLVGAKGTLVDRDTSNPLPQDLKRRLLEKMESPETLLVLMEHGLALSQLKKMQKDSMATAKKLEQMRSLESRNIRDNALRRRVTLVKYLVTVVNPKVARFLLSIDVDARIFADRVLKDQERIIRFFQSMPTSYCAVQLTLYRDMQRMRRVQPNDLNDIMSLSIAIPYSDIVVTERMWQRAIIQTKLNELRPTLVLRSAKELAPILGLD
jgi:hypothetical protein